MVLPPEDGLTWENPGTGENTEAAWAYFEAAKDTRHDQREAPAAQSLG